ncbi:MAG: ABC transporter substrate-binding protein [Bacteroidota bacterium]
MTLINLALDWTPNINHIGFFVARDKGFYADLGLEVSISDPSSDNYQTTPAKRVELGTADFALCPTESIISYRTKSNPFPLVAMAALLQEDLSAIVVKADSDIKSPKDLDGKTYSSYAARYEDHIVREMIKNDGGQGDLKVVYPDKLGIWNTLLEDVADATWIFVNWEGVVAEQADVPLRYFRMKDYQIPYSYSPVIAANARIIEEKRTAYDSFLAATKAGFLYTQSHPKESIEILKPLLPKSDQHVDLNRALEITAPHFGTEESWGSMEKQVISNFLDWIYDNNLEDRKIDISDIVFS